MTLAEAFSRHACQLPTAIRLDEAAAEAAIGERLQSTRALAIDANAGCPVWSVLPASGTEVNAEGGDVGCLNLNITAIENLRVGAGAFPMLFEAIEHDPAHAIVAERECRESQTDGIGIAS